MIAYSAIIKDLSRNRFRMDNRPSSSVRFFFTILVIISTDCGQGLASGGASTVLTELDPVEKAYKMMDSVFPVGPFAFFCGGVLMQQP